jgi:hypothetical protein
MFLVITQAILAAQLFSNLDELLRNSQQRASVIESSSCPPGKLKEIHPGSLQISRVRATAARPRQRAARKRDAEDDASAPARQRNLR